LAHDTVLEQAANWLLHSGIQKPDGGVARYYLSAERRYLPISAEITGYAASALAFLHSATGMPGLLERLRITADYLAGAWIPKLSVFPFEMDDGTHTLAYFFDTGIILRGLSSAGRADSDPKWPALVTAGARGMLQRYGAGAAIPPVIELPHCRPLPLEPRWSRLPGCYQAKSALAWREVFEQTGDAALGQAWHDTLAAAIASHETFLPGAAEPARVMDRLHAYCYFLEALLFAPDTEHRAAQLAGGIARVAGLLHSIAPEVVRSDVYAQLLRIRLYAAPAVPLDAEAAGREAAALRQFQARHHDPAIHGGFWFGRNRDGFLPFVNPVSTIFGVQALHLWQQWQNGQRPGLQDVI
jgi:hypothetical protein